MGMGMGGMRNGRMGGSVVPQAETPPAEPEKLTADQAVDAEMPKITETLELDPFEEAVVRSILVRNVQKRMELQILNLEPQKMREGYQKLIKEQDEELKESLTPEKYQLYLEMRDNPEKTRRKQKKKKKKNKEGG